MVELAALCSKTDLDIPEAFSIGQLGESHAQVLIQTGEPVNLPVPFVPIYTAAERVHGKMVHHLSENEFSRIHLLPP
jgi:hypothetical protein